MMFISSKMRCMGSKARVKEAPTVYGAVAMGKETVWRSCILPIDKDNV
jgi:hypothetical protein